MKKMFFVLALCGIAFANPVGGGKYSNTKVLAHSSDTYIIRLYGEENTLVTISGDGDTDLDLYVYDENGNEVCNSISSGDDESCSITPRWTGKFKIEVKNRGGVYNNYNITIE